jgi:outer membrane protein TolC
MNYRPYRFTCLALLIVAGGVASVAQDPLTLRQAIYQALGQNPEAAMARAGNQEAKSAATMARIQLLPQLNFTEDISRGNDPVYAFGTKLRQRQFTGADFVLNALNFPQPIGNFSTRFSGSWMVFDSFKTQREIRRADLYRKSTSSSAKAVDQQIVLRVVQAYESVLYAQREVAVAQHEQETAAALLNSIEERVKTGLAVESDRMSALVNEAARKEELIAAKGDLELAWAELREAMGASKLEATELKPTEPHRFPQQPLDEEMATAAKTRPDLRSLGEMQSAQASSDSKLLLHGWTSMRLPARSRSAGASTSFSPVAMPDSTSTRLPCAAPRPCRGPSTPSSPPRAAAPCAAETCPDDGVPATDPAWQLLVPAPSRAAPRSPRPEPKLP